MKRKYQLANDQIYHIFCRSIAEFRIFNKTQDYKRMLYLLLYFQIADTPNKFSNFLQLDQVKKRGFYPYFNEMMHEQKKLVKILAYCLMTTHIHLIIKQLQSNGISTFMSNVLNAYSRYFNVKYHRKGPLWESKFQNVQVENDEQLLHLTRYIHLNPTTANIVDRPENWVYSSYKGYIGQEKNNLCEYQDLFSITPKDYEKFVMDGISYQRELNRIKKIIID